MASIRRLKKDINFLTSELVTHAFINNTLSKMSDEEVKKAVEDAIDFRNEFIDRANNPDGKDNPTIVKKHYKKLRKDMISSFSKQFDALAEKLN
ncbi:hypothetical protein QA597_11420 [Marinilabiliaceae bacterium ANBcel2]|nr:hypothetical protein [Marinilabiliaceae bacterium ANBcel2]